CINSISYVLFTFAFSLLTLLTLAACEESFNPMQQNDQYPFSIHGYLDASQDTNWVRITAVRDSLFMGPDTSLDAVVTLEHLESGQKVTLEGSLFRYFGDHYAYNFRAVMELEVGQNYRLIAKRSDGAESSATVTLPPEFTTPYMLPMMLIIPEIEHLADVQVLYHMIFHLAEGDTHRIISFRHLADTVPGTSPGKQVRINTRPHFEFFRFLDPHTILKREVKVSSAGPDWHNFSEIDENLISLPEGISNIEGGTGYLIGVVSKTILWPI
ncbi:MAG: DUF4249 family protein, partial [Balneolaceae bacterium]|nr:DUF4249 family protein [Balneolaceae bacterium]